MLASKIPWLYLYLFLLLILFQEYVLLVKLNIMDDNNEEMQNMYKTHIFDGESLLLKLKESNFTRVRGIDKLGRKIKRDILFLSETSQSNRLKKEHLICSNLHFYKAIIDDAQNQTECEAVLQTFSYKTADNSKKRLTVDIVSSKGQRWTKVIARNPLALHQIYKEGDAFGRRSILDQATSYAQAASQNLNLYAPPQVVFSFVNGVPETIKTFLEKLGIVVEGQIIAIEDDLSSDSDTLEPDSESDGETCDIVSAVVPAEQKTVTKLNLCVTTLIAYVSALTNGGCFCAFQEPILEQQAEWERASPVKPLLDELFEGKELICCTTALEDFKKILSVVGGEEEKRRATEFLARVTEVAGVIYAGLEPSGKIKRRSLEIFGTGHAFQAPTVTANKGFLQAALQKGVKFASIVHESRALTERKQLPHVSEDLKKLELDNKFLNA